MNVEMWMIKALNLEPLPQKAKFKKTHDKWKLRIEVAARNTVERALCVDFPEIRLAALLRDAESADLAEGNNRGRGSWLGLNANMKPTSETGG